jgi:hypothetical protein
MFGVVIMHQRLSKLISFAAGQDLASDHVAGYMLVIGAADQVGDHTVAGSCEGGAKKIVQQRKASAAAEARAPTDSPDKEVTDIARRASATMIGMAPAG